MWIIAQVKTPCLSDRAPTQSANVQLCLKPTRAVQDFLHNEAIGPGSLAGPLPNADDFGIGSTGLLLTLNATRVAPRLFQTGSDRFVLGFLKGSIRVRAVRVLRFGFRAEAQTCFV